MRVYELLELDASVDGDVGLELEVEANAPLPAKVEGWRLDKDNSLRGAYQGEYILTGVSKTDLTLKAKIDDLCAKLNDPKRAVVHGSPRTSFHVHRNVTPFTLINLWCGVIAWWVFEDYLIDTYCDKVTRKDNHFALPVSKANDLADTALDAIHSPKPMGVLRDDNLKYGAQNLWSMTQLGSVEYRPMEGHTNAARMWNWVQMISGIYPNCRRHFNDPIHMMKMIDELGYAYVFNLVFPDQIDHKDPAVVAKIAGSCMGSMSFAMMLAFAHSDWTGYQSTMGKMHDENIKRLKKDGLWVAKQPRAPRAVPQPDAMDELLQRVQDQVQPAPLRAVNPAPIPRAAHKWVLDPIGGDLVPAEDI